MNDMTSADKATNKSSRWNCFAKQIDRTKSVRVSREAIPNLLQIQNPVWVDVEGATKEDIAWLKQTFEFHDLALEDVLNEETRPKQELYDETLFTVFTAINFNPNQTTFDRLNLYIFLGQDFIVTVHSQPLKSIQHISRIVEARQGVLTRGLDYLYYMLLDNVIDWYFDILDKIEDDIDKIEENIFNDEMDDVQEAIFATKRKIMHLKRSIGPKREALRILVYADFPQISRDIQIHLRDILDHVLRIDDMLESYRELLNGLIDLHRTEIANRLNEIMKLLSVISTIMLPLSFLTGLFGMNFAVMPGLDWQYGFWVLLGFMALLVTFLIWFFKHNKNFVTRCGDSLRFNNEFNILS